MASAPVRIFVFGTLLERVIQIQVFQREIKPAKAFLRGFEIRDAQAGQPRMLAPSRARAVAVGGVLTLQPGELALADTWEECPDRFRRRRITVVCDGAPLECWVYLPRPQALKVAAAAAPLGTLRIKLSDKVVSVAAADYIRLKTKDLVEFGYTKLTEADVEAQVRLILGGAARAKLSVIGGFIVKDLVV